MEIQFKKHVRVICDLKIGDKVKTDEWGYQLDGIVREIEDIKAAFGKCTSGFLVKITGYDNYIDSNWLDKIS